MKRQSLLLVDGHNLLFQMFYGMPNKIYGKDGMSCHGVIGFIGGLLKSLTINNPDYLLIVFDGEDSGNRREINSNYKANRIDYSQVPISENPFSQYPQILKALDYINIKYYETDGYEADDLIASYVKHYQDEIKVLIQSNDTDFLQLINQNVNIFKYRGKNSKRLTEKEVVLNFGVTPDKIALLKSLVGDKSDNLIGVSKVGVKTAAKLLNKFNTIENIYHNIDSIESESIRSNLITDKDTVFKNYALINLTGEIELPYHLDELKCKANYQDYKTFEVLKKINIL
jgi:DNA polymerase-1